MGNWIGKLTSSSLHFLITFLPPLEFVLPNGDEIWPQSLTISIDKVSLIILEVTENSRVNNYG